MNRTRLFPLALVAPVLLASAARAADWPQWRGPNRDGRSSEKGLLKQWPEGGPEILWKVDTVSEAYSSVAVANGRIYTQGNIDGEGRILCLEESTGATVWSVKPPTEDRMFRHNRGSGGRGTPTVDGNFVYSIGGGGDLTCLTADSGEVVWSKHLIRDFGGGRPGWGFSESPLIDGAHVIVTPGGGKGAVAALNKETGELVWQSDAVTDKAHYCSAIVVESHGVRQIIQFTGGAGNRRNPISPPRVVGIDAASGDLLWSYEKSANRTANVATPIFHNNRVFSSSAYGTGGGLVTLAKSDDGFSATEGYFERSMGNHHGGIVLVDGYMYGFGSGGLLCMNFESGEIAWRDRSVRKGSLCYADGHLYCYGEKNQVALVEANPEEYVEKGRFNVDQGDWPTWAHPVVANGRLYLRDMQNLTCYNVKAE